MLSPHEFATLLLVRDAADQIANREDLGSLLEQQLVSLERLACGTTVALTTEGLAVVDALSQIH